MDQKFQHNFITTGLNPTILSTPFKVQTNWHVITGATCSGKTTLIDLLARQGYKIVPEIARIYYQNESKKQAVPPGHRARISLTRGLTRILLSAESALPAQDLLFLDRAFPDQLTYYRIHGLDPNEILADCFRHRYASVFLLDRFSFKPDGVRYEDDRIAEFLAEWHAKDYRALGYDVIRVPAFSPQERLAFVLGKISKQ